MSTAVAPTANGSGGAIQTAPPTSLQVYNSEATDEKTRYETAVREAVALSKSTWTPKHLIGRTDAETQATCVGLVIMARKWDMAASMVAGETYSVHGKIGFQGKLYAALANAHGGLVGGLRTIYSGSGDKLTCVVFGSDHQLTKEDKDALKKLVKTGDSDAATDLELNGVKAIRISVGQCKTDQKMWTTDPEQKLFYSGATKWCRKFMPDLVLGAVSVEDIERVEYLERAPQESHASRTAALEDRLSLGSVPANPVEVSDENQASDPQDD